MSEAGVPSMRQVLEDGILKLNKLRNQTGPTIAFKKWRKSMLEAIAAMWPEDRAKVSRLLRIPFLPASSKAERSELRRVYERGCGEASSYLKGLLAEYDREVSTGQRAGDASAAPAPASPLDADGLPNMSWLDQSGSPDAELPPAEMDELRSVTDEFLSSSPVFSVPGSSGAPHAEPGRVELSPSALAIMAMAVEIEALGVPDGERPRVREALLDLARNLDTAHLSWRQLRLTIAVVMEYPAIARRVLPMIVPFLDRAA